MKISELNLTHDYIANFWSNTDRTLGCWNWKGATNNKGYGHIGIRRGGRLVMVYAHRLAYAFVNGDFEDKLLVLHRCDNPRCIRPDHLFLGTHKTNRKDMLDKGRERYVLPNPIFRGEMCSHSKLTEKDIHLIRQRLSNGESQSSIGRSFSVTQTAISAIATGRNWAHV